MKGRRPEGEKGLHFECCVRSYTVQDVSLALRQHFGDMTELGNHRLRRTVSLATSVRPRGICSVCIFRDAGKLHGNVFLGVRFTAYPRLDSFDYSGRESSGRIEDWRRVRRMASAIHQALAFRSGSVLHGSTELLAFRKGKDSG